MTMFGVPKYTVNTVPLEEPRRSSVSGDRVTRSASRRAARAQQPPPQSSPQPQPQPTTPPPGTWTSTKYMPRVTPGYTPGWDQPMYQQDASRSAWASAGSGEWAMPTGATYGDATSSSSRLCSSSHGGYPHSADEQAPHPSWRCGGGHAPAR
jgi:hypothetical protein